jgi:hypothetical protein
MISKFRGGHQGIGYKRPPKHTQFLKGQSGNPKGRPKNSKNFLTLLETELKRPVSIQENGKKKTVSKREAMIKRIVHKAMEGPSRVQYDFFLADGECGNAGGAASGCVSDPQQAG